MAEFVQRNIEDMIPELEQMERIGLFDSKETKYVNLYYRPAHKNECLSQSLPPIMIIVIS